MALTDVKISASSIQVQLDKAQERIRTLENLVKRVDIMEWRPPCYWIPRDIDGIQEPYCQSCFDGNEKLSRLHSVADKGFHCKGCGNFFDEYEEHIENSKQEANSTISKKAKKYY
jgi:hypothetical protein